MGDIHSQDRGWFMCIKSESFDRIIASPYANLGTVLGFKGISGG